MAEVSRRRFLVQSSFGLSAAAIGGAVVAVAPRVLANTPVASMAPAAHMSAAELAVPLVVHVRNAATGEVSLMYGGTETVYRDRELVGRLLSASRQGRA